MTKRGIWLAKWVRKLARLGRDNRGNVLGMAAAMLAVTTVLAGSTVDTARLYLVKARLQQACDSGVLAGRRVMVDSANPVLETHAATQANNFFRSNFRDTWLGTSSVTFTPLKTANNRVSGEASAVVPMTLTRIVGMPNQTITVRCEARYDLPDTDIMFVLDTTGSMACLPSEDNTTCSATVNSQGNTTYTRPADSLLGQGTGSVNQSVPGYPGSTGYYVNERTGSRMAALRTAVINFYNTMAANVKPGTNIRYGFVTYSSSVNAGRAIMDVNPQFMVGGAGNATNTWTYQSRRVSADYQVSSATQATYTNTNSTTCNTYRIARNPATPLTYDPVTSQATERTVAMSGNTCTVTNRVYGPQWTYQPVAHNVSNFLTSTTVDDPTQVDTRTARWQGCVEERGTTASTSFNVESLPPDLNPDLIPSDDATRWRPAWPEVTHTRNYAGGANIYSSTASTTSNGEPTNIATGLSYFRYNTDQLMRSGWYTCGKPVRRLATMSLTDVTNYVNAADFRPHGGTYHDIGMIWGVRMISPNGIFGNDTAAWPGRGAPNRIIVFLTDGAMAPGLQIYGQYGVEYFDQRVTGGTYANLTANHNARFLAACAAARARNISVWTIALGLAATPELQQCASNAQQSLSSTSGSDLNNKFQSIALLVARLRVSQ